MIMKKINILTFIIGLLFIGMSNIYAQAQISVPLQVTNNSATPTVLNLAVGLDVTATAGLDPALGEANLPPLPPAGAFDARFILGAQSSLRDYRNAPSFPFTGSITHILQWQQQTGGTQIIINYDVPANATITIQDQLGGIVFNSGPLTGTGTYTITSPLTAANVIMDYTNISPVAAGPVFDISPASPLTVAPTAVGGSNTANVTVSNSGTAALNISGITSSNPEFSISPTTASIPVAGNQVFVVTFTPASLGPKTSDLVFTHDAPGSPTTYVVDGIGAEAGPTFAVSPASLTFNTNQGVPVSQNITVTNDGALNTLNITSVATAAPFSVTPSSATVIPGASQVFSVTFNPTVGGSGQLGTLTFNHNGTTSPDVVNLTGNATSVFGLVFKDEERIVKEDSTYSDFIQLKSLSATTQAIQFRLLVNKSADDDAIVTFQSLEKGTDVATADWNLQYEVFRGPLTSNGASVDSIYVLLYNLQQNTGLAAGDHDNLLIVNYRIADLPALQDSSKSSFLIVEEQGSTFQGFPVNILGSRDEFKLNAKNRVSSLGDVNGDGSLDILDLINVVDHIVGRDSLCGDPNKIGETCSDLLEFIRADIAPWPIGLTSTPDGFVNVQDLALIQDIILTGSYPDGTVLNKASFLAGNENSSLNKVNGAATVKLHITKEGIAVRLDSEVGIRGAQLEFGSVEDNTSNMIIDSRLGGGFYNQINELLRVLLYDPSGNAVINAGENFVANIPFALENPQDISVDKIILVDIMNKKVGEINVEIFYENAPEIPIDYSLSQNFPNPFNPTTSVKFSVPKDGFVTLKVYDMIGQEVATLFAGNAQRGTYTLNWNGKDNSGKYVSSGSYVYRMSANNGEFVQSKKMIFLK